MGGLRHGSMQVFGKVGQEVGRLAHVALGGGGSDGESGGQAGIGTAVHADGSAPGVRDPGAAIGGGVRCGGCGSARRTAQGAVRQRNHGRAGQQRGSWLGHRILVGCCLTGSLISPQPGSRCLR